jgi:hypothetical protein
LYHSCPILHSTKQQGDALLRVHSVLCLLRAARNLVRTLPAVRVIKISPRANIVSHR